MVKDLHKLNITAEAIHGNKSQNARQRALNNFKDKTTRVLIATDIAARGIDIDELAYVINYEIPNIPETYVHRIGRTGRAGANGIALSFCDREEIGYIKDIHKLIGKQIPVNEEHPYPMSAASLASPLAPPAQGGNRGGGNRGGGSRAGENPRSGQKRGRGFGSADKKKDKNRQEGSMSGKPRRAK